MKKKRNDFGNLHHGNDETGLLFQRVKWTEDGILHLGTVTEIFDMNGIRYLSVMSIFGKRSKVKMSKVRLVSEQVRA